MVAESAREHADQSGLVCMSNVAKTQHPHGSKMLPSTWLPVAGVN